MTWSSSRSSPKTCKGLSPPGSSAASSRSLPLRTGFAVLFRLVSDFSKKGGQLKISNLDPSIRLGAEIVGLDKVADIYDTEAAALAAFNRPER
jgi:hypothetical protein